MKTIELENKIRLDLKPLTNLIFRIYHSMLNTYTPKTPFCENLFKDKQTSIGGAMFIILNWILQQWKWFRRMALIHLRNNSREVSHLYDPVFLSTESGLLTNFIPEIITDPHPNAVKWSASGPKSHTHFRSGASYLTYWPQFPHV